MIVRDLQVIIIISVDVAVGQNKINKGEIINADLK